MDEALERVASLEGEATVAAAPATDAVADRVADGFAAAKTKHVPAPSPKPPRPDSPEPLAPDAGPDLHAVVNGAAAPLDAAVSPLEQVQARLVAMPGVEAVGEDRFVLAASQLFAPGQAALSQRGLADLQPIADHLRRWLADLPPGTVWRLHVDGHADDGSARQGAFGSGLELARARAGAVANYLAARGLPAERLAVDALADPLPLEPAVIEAAPSRNWRVELRLTAE